jgi:hypothetical protein
VQLGVLWLSGLNALCFVTVRVPGSGGCEAVRGRGVGHFSFMFGYVWLCLVMFAYVCFIDLTKLGPS